jgi:hypothetical protein
MMIIHTEQTKNATDNNCSHNGTMAISNDVTDTNSLCEGHAPWRQQLVASGVLVCMYCNSDLAPSLYR